MTMGWNRLRAGILGACAFALIAPAALAADGTDVTVTGGSLTITNPAAANFTPVTLDGLTAKTTTATLDAFTVNDATGTGVGWHVTAGATQFVEWDTTTNVAVTNGHDLDANSLTMSQPTVAPTTTDVLSPSPTVNAGSYTIDGASAVTIASAAAGEGMGSYDFGATTLTVAIPVDTYTATYHSTVTISVVSTP